MGILIRQCIQSISFGISVFNRITSVFKEREKVNWEEERLKMVDYQIIKRGIKDERVLEAMRKVPRHLFVPVDQRRNAYEDCPLSIGEGQTISQPYMVACMTEALRLQGSEKVLELGTGSGYQTAILAELSEAVYTIERIAVLSERAQQTLKELNYQNVHFKVGDGTYGWPEERPFDRIIVTAGAPDISQVLIDQLNEDGILVVPVGSRYSQTLYRVVKKKEKVEKENITLCVFVPLIGDHGWKEE
jgi:protein-L-isoaspartate(D-aspartate) O-methyltransferase